MQLSLLLTTNFDKLAPNVNVQQVYFSFNFSTSHTNYATWISPRNCQADSLDLAEILLERYAAQADTQVLTPLFFTHTESEQQA